MKKEYSERAVALADNTGANEALTRHLSQNPVFLDSFADYKRGFFDGYEAAKQAGQPAACQDEGCPHFGKAVKCEPKPGGCIATVAKQPDESTGRLLVPLSCYGSAEGLREVKQDGEYMVCYLRGYEVFRFWLGATPLKRESIDEVKQYVANLIRSGYVDANDKAFDGVRSIYQMLHGLPRTGASCPEIAAIEDNRRRG